MAVLGEIGSPVTHCVQGPVADAWTGVDVQTDTENFPEPFPAPAHVSVFSSYVKSWWKAGPPGRLRAQHH